MKALLGAIVVGLALGLAGGGASAATSPAEMLEDPALEERARELGKELRCLVCQNQSIDDSDAPLARDLRQVVRERLLAGDSNDEVMGYVTARYGDFVLLRPPVRSTTWVLWYGPVVVVLLGGIGAVFWLRRQGHARRVVEPLSEAEEAELKRVMDGRS